MTKIHRRVLGLAVAVLAAAAPARAAELEKLLPNDTDSVMMVNVRQMLDSELVKKLGLIGKAKEALKTNQEASEILEGIGLDPFKDVDSIYVAGPASAEPDKGLFIVNGNFDVEKIKAKAEEVAQKHKDNLKAVKVPDGLGGNYTFYEVTTAESPQAIFVTVANKNTILASPGKDYLIDALDKLAGRKKTELKNKDIAALVARLDSKQSLYATLPGDSLLKSPLGQDDTAKEILEKVQDLAFGLTLDKNLKLNFTIGAKKADDAKALNEKIKDGLNQGLGFLALVAGQNKQFEPIIDLLKKLAPEVKDKVVSVTLEIPGEVIENALKGIDN
jgi:hypothetical protein